MEVGRPGFEVQSFGQEMWLLQTRQKSCEADIGGHSQGFDHGQGFIKDFLVRVGKKMMLVETPPPP